ncbi:hypothetical protein HK100_011183 [Physocladia obscura]|uniref:Uncharacterized protein n=1 Tax=Physocladia obscura TaxID=109957 RepID=A0AAD5XIH2_9FUNG|nr:hypothetical protein HK100_011183 [Physocladia obscura]
MLAQILTSRPTLRPFSKIIESDAFTCDAWRPNPAHKDLSRDKHRLQYHMESNGGKIALAQKDSDTSDIECAVSDTFEKGGGGSVMGNNGSSTASVGYGRRKGKKFIGTAKAAELSSFANREIDGDIDEFDMVFKEIEDRKQWLDDMIALGRGEVYKKQIQTEIAQRVKRLEEIDREKTSLMTTEYSPLSVKK